MVRLTVGVVRWATLRFALCLLPVRSIATPRGMMRSVVVRMAGFAKGLYQLVVRRIFGDSGDKSPSQLPRFLIESRAAAERA